MVKGWMEGGLKLVEWRFEGGGLKVVGGWLEGG